MHARVDFTNTFHVFRLTIHGGISLVCVEGGGTHDFFVPVNWKKGSCLGNCVTSFNFISSFVENFIITSPTYVLKWWKHLSLFKYLRDMLNIRKIVLVHLGHHGFTLKPAIPICKILWDFEKLLLLVSSRRGPKTAVGWYLSDLLFSILLSHV